MGAASDAGDEYRTVSIECATCVARHTEACDDCLVSAVLGPEREAIRLDEEEQRAVVELQVAGLVPLVRYRRESQPRRPNRQGGPVPSPERLTCEEAQPAGCDASHF